MAAEGLPTAAAFVPEQTEVRLSRQELCQASGLTPEQLEQLEQYGLLGARTGGSHYDGDALVIARTVGEMARFGIEARHLRPFKTAAEREIGLVEQVVTPLVRQRGPEARARAQEATARARGVVGPPARHPGAGRARLRSRSLTGAGRRLGWRPRRRLGSRPHVAARQGGRQ